jgi:DNA-binding transcriptional ArsR family regulator
MVTHKTLSCLGDRVRWEIAQRLAERPLTVNRIAAGFGISRPAISRHLRVLREAGIVSESRAGRERLYRLEPEALLRAAARLAETASGPRREPGPSPLWPEPERLSEREPPRPTESRAERPSERQTDSPAERSSGRAAPHPSAEWRQW